MIKGRYNKINKEGKMMNVKAHITNNESGISQRNMFISGVLGLGDSAVEILSLGKVSIDLRLQWAYHCVCNK